MIYDLEDVDVDLHKQKLCDYELKWCESEWRFTSEYKMDLY